MGKRICDCRRFRPGSAYDLSQCRPCWLYHHRPAEIGFADGARAVPAPGAATAPRPGPRRPLPCAHLGAYVRRVHSACGRNHVRHCDAGHGAVTQNGFCETCPDYAPD